MRTLEELKDFFNTKLLHAGLSELEQERKNVLNNLWIAYGVIAVIVTIGVLLTFEHSQALMMVVFLAVAAGGSAHAWITKTYRSRFKDVVIEPLIAFFDENLRYAQNGYIPQGVYAESKIFLSRVDRYRGDDLVEGMIGKTAVRFSELHTEYKTTSSKGGTHWHPIFKGLFFTADFHKHFKGRTVVLPNFIGSLFGSGEIGGFLSSATRDTRIKMDDPVFERNFNVYGTDQIEARYILTSSLMKRIVDFKEKTKRAICLSFVHSNVYIAIPYSKDLFEPNVFKTLLSFSMIEEYFTDLKLALDIAEDLNLNTRIWTKE